MGVEMFAAAFFGGVLTSASPCTLAAVPVAVGFVGGQGASVRRSWVLSGSFVLGMTIALTVLGMAAARLGLFLGTLPGLWSAAVGLIVVALGVWIWIGHGTGLNSSATALVRRRTQGSGVPGALLLGALLGTVMSPCATPPLVAALVLAGSGAITDASPWQGAALLSAYGLGHGALLLVAGALPGIAQGMIRSLDPVQRWVPGRRVFATLLAAAGGWWTLQAFAG
jgi:cytochrome c-type biogenesis protein